MTTQSIFRKEPICLVVPGLNNSGPRHWQTLWEQARPDCERVDLGSWSNPHRNHWVTKLDLAIAAEVRPIVLVAHSLGCLAVAWWAALTEPSEQAKVIGALLVAPPDVEDANAKPVVQRFAPAPRTTFRFPSIVVASSDDPYATLDRSRVFARRWGAEFVDAGPIGHINADSFLGEWPEGRRLLDHLLGGADRGASPDRPVRSPDRGLPRLRGH
jgi:predicted alpha/beta hydrolase family esterase